MKQPKLHLLLARINATSAQDFQSPDIINLTNELSHSLRGGNGGCGEELPPDGGNSSCNNSCSNGACSRIYNAKNNSCTNTNCITFEMSNTTCSNLSCS